MTYYLIEICGPVIYGSMSFSPPLHQWDNVITGWAMGHTEVTVFDFSLDFLFFISFLRDFPAAQSSPSNFIWILLLRFLKETIQGEIMGTTVGEIYW